MAFFIGDVPFEDCRHANSKELKAAGKLTFGALPVLEADGQILSQTQAMAVYAAKLAGIHPTDDAWLSAKVDECISGCTDVTGTVGTTFRIQDAGEKIAARKALIDKESGRLHMHLNGLEMICAANNHKDGYSVGSSLTVADLAIWRLVGWIDSGTLDGIPENHVADTFPALNKLVAMVDAHPKVIEWKAKHSKFYS
jgi:glutathione S-transferase